MLDLFSGSGGASRAAAVRGWQVVRIDNGAGGELERGSSGASSGAPPRRLPDGLRLVQGEP
jgi:hypothetical protein